jgi:hypothetical protein
MMKLLSWHRRKYPLLRKGGKMKSGEQLILLALCGTILTLTGCTSLSEKQKAMLSTVSVRPYEMAECAFHKPDGTASPNASSGVPAATGGGLIPSLIGSSIDASVTSKQQKEFEKNNGQYFKKANEGVPGDIAKRLETRTIKVLNSDPFFSPRMTPESSSYFGGKILNYGLTRLTENNGNVYLEAKINLDIWLVGSNGKKMFHQLLSASSIDAYTMQQYAADKSLSERVFEQALDDFEVQLIKLTNVKLGR